MINELLLIQKDLNNQGVTLSNNMLHSDIKKVPRLPSGGAYNALLDKSGNLLKLEEINKDDWEKQLYYFPHNHCQFPVIKFDKLDSESGKQKTLKKFEKMCETGIKELSSQIDLKKLCYTGCVKLFDALKKSNLQVLFNQIVEQIEKYENSSSLDVCYVSLDIHCQDFDENHLSFKNPKLFREISKDMSKNSVSKTNDDKKDNLGNSLHGYDKPFNVQCHRVGKLLLYSKNDQSPSNMRYGLNGANAFKIGNESRAGLLSSFQTLIDEKNYNKTFKDISIDGSTRLLIFVYLDEIQNVNDVKFPNCLLNFEDIKRQNFLEECEEMTRVFESVVLKVPSAQYKIFCAIIHGNDQPYFVYNKNFSVSNVIESIRSWTKDSQIAWVNDYIKSEILSPLMFWKILGNQIKTKGHSEYIELKSSNKNLTVYEIFDFFLGNNKNLSKITKLVANNHAKMLIKHVDKKMFNFYNVKYIYSIIGIILSRYERSSYMNDLAFQIGQLCAVANRIQKLYCKVRYGTVPNKLIGSSHIEMFMRNPTRALLYLTKKINPYREWIENNVGKVEYAGYYVAKLNTLYEEITKHRNEIETLKITDIFKLEIALGYSSKLSNVSKEKGEKEKEK